MEGFNSLMEKGIEAEMSVLGCMMLDEECARTAVDRLAPEMFTHPALRAIFEAATDLYWAGSKIDYSSLSNKIPEYAKTLVKLAEYVPTWSHCDEYIKIIIDNWRISSIKEALISILGQTDCQTADETLDKIKELTAQQANILTAQSNDSISFAQASKEFLEWLRSNGEKETIKTGYSFLDRAMGGFLRKTVTALCARSGKGKTDFAINLLMRMAKAGFKVQYFTIEMTTNQLMQRIASQMARINGDVIRDKKLSEGEINDVSTALAEFKGSGKISFIEDGKVSTKTIRHYLELFKPDIIFIDHLGLMERPNIKDQYHALGLVSNELKQIAKEYNIAIVELVQMNRNIESRKDNIPTLADLRESGDIEQDADYVMFTVPEDMIDKRISDEGWVDTTLYLLKNRHGSPTKIQFHWQPQYHTFYEVENNFKEG